MENKNQKIGQSVVEFVLVATLVGLGLFIALASLSPNTLREFFRGSIAPSGEIEGDGQLNVPPMGQ